MWIFSMICKQTTHRIWEIEGKSSAFPFELISHGKNRIQEEKNVIESGTNKKFTLHVVVRWNENVHIQMQLKLERMKMVRGARTYNPIEHLNMLNACERNERFDKWNANIKNTTAQCIIIIGGKLFFGKYSALPRIFHVKTYFPFFDVLQIYYSIIGISTEYSEYWNERKVFSFSVLNENEHFKLKIMSARLIEHFIFVISLYRKYVADANGIGNIFFLPCYSSIFLPLFYIDIT